MVCAVVGGGVGANSVKDFIHGLGVFAHYPCLVVLFASGEARRRFLLGMWRPECVRGVNGDALGAVDGGGVAELNVVGDV